MLRVAIKLLRTPLAATSLAAMALVLWSARLGVADRGAFLGAALEDDLVANWFCHGLESVE